MKSFSATGAVEKGVKTMDLAKRLIDYGFHPYNDGVSADRSGALMIEPTESEPKEELDLFIEAMKSIARKWKKIAVRARRSAQHAHLAFG